MPYIPLSARDGRNNIDYAALHEGTPDWIRGRLYEWLHSNLMGSHGRYYVQVLEEIELDFRRSFGGTGVRAHRYW